MDELIKNEQLSGLEEIADSTLEEVDASGGTWGYKKGGYKKGGWGGYGGYKGGGYKKRGWGGYKKRGWGGYGRYH